jgi:WD40 repeat protein
MSVDRRLREGLNRSSAPIDDRDIDVIFTRIVRNARRRRRVRWFVTAAVLFAVGLAVFVLLPKAFDDLAGDRPVPADRGSGKPALRVSGYGFGFSTDGSSLFARALDSSGAIYDAGTAALLQTVSGRGESVVAFSPDGSRFVTVKGDPACCHTYLYETATGRELLHIREACCFATFSPDGRFLAVPRRGTSVIDVATGEIVNNFTPWGAMAFSPNGQRLLVSPYPHDADEGVIAYIYDVGGGSEPVQSLVADTGGGNVPDVYVDWQPWSADGSMVAAPTSTGSVIVWDSGTGEEMFEVARSAARFVSCAFSPDDRLATGARNGTAAVWSVAGDVAEPLITIHAYDRRVDHVVFDPEGDLMTASWHRPTKVWDISP